METTVNSYVARGRTVLLGDGPHGPGEAVSLDIIDTRRLTKLGFLQPTPPNLAPLPASNNPTGIGLQTSADVQGPTYTR